MRRHRLTFIAVLAVAGCSSDAPKEPPKPAPAGTPVAAPAGTPAAAPGAPVAPAAPKPAPPPPKLSVLEEARRRTLTKDDFTESDTNRDPFRSFLASFASQQKVSITHPIVLEKFAVDELKLAGIITGELPARAMFIDPAGNGVTVRRGDHVSKVDALVTRIAPDRVYLRIEEDTGTDKPRVTERQIELHAGELTAQ